MAYQRTVFGECLPDESDPTKFPPGTDCATVQSAPFRDRDRTFDSLSVPNTAGRPCLRPSAFGRSIRCARFLGLTVSQPFATPQPWQAVPPPWRAASDRDCVKTRSRIHDSGMLCDSFCLNRNASNPRPRNWQWITRLVPVVRDCTPSRPAAVIERPKRGVAQWRRNRDRDSARS